MKDKKFPVIYQKKIIMVPLLEPPKKGFCVGCKRSVREGIKMTQIHHHKYAHRIEKVLENPLLALDNTSEFCFFCHRIGDSLRTLLTLKEENLGKIIDVAELMPEDMRQKLDIVCKLWISRRENVNKKRHINDYI